MVVGERAGDALKAMLSMIIEEGVRVWQLLYRHFGSSFASHQGAAPAERSGMMASLARNPDESLTLAMELERRAKVAEDAGEREQCEADLGGPAALRDAPWRNGCLRKVEGSRARAYRQDGEGGQHDAGRERGAPRDC